VCRNFSLIVRRPCNAAGSGTASTSQSAHAQERWALSRAVRAVSHDGWVEANDGKWAICLALHGRQLWLGSNDALPRILAFPAT
jgi:hypothetical protein